MATKATDWGPYYIANLVLVALWITPLSILWFISLCLARRRRDPARVGISWLKATYPVWVFALIFNTIVGAMQVFLWYDDKKVLVLGSEVESVARASDHINITAQFFEFVGDILLLVTFVELSSGFLLCLNGGGPTPIRKYGRIAILIWGLVLFILALAIFGFSHSIVVRFWNSLTARSSYTNPRYADSLSYINDVVTLHRLGGATCFLIWISSIPILAYASYVVHKTKNHAVLRSGAILLLAATILDFVRLLVHAAIFAASYLDNPVLVAEEGTTIDPAVSFYVDDIFDYVFMFVVLVLLFALAVRKANGLWLHPGGWTNSPFAAAPGTVAYLPDGRPVQIYPAAAPPQGLHGPGQQQQQQQPMQQKLPAYLQVAQQRQGQGYNSYPPQQQYNQQQQQHHPNELYQQGGRQASTAAPAPAATG